MERGLRQGDPLSPSLFIIAVEAFNVSVLHARNNNLFHGVKVGVDNVHVSHLQFADDALIMGEWSLLNAKNLSRILTCFHLASGLKVNFHKSKLFSIGVTNSDVNSLASTIGCLPSHFPCTYLGFPISENMARCANWMIIGLESPLLKVEFPHALLFRGLEYHMPIVVSYIAHPTFHPLASTHVVPDTNFSVTCPLPHTGLEFHWAWRRPIRSGPESDELTALCDLVAQLRLTGDIDLWECTMDDTRIFT
ncbi:putative RNA-directed DNA polymerase, eukaryota, reverse transcriptase zinc-binding domain protein, partial [Tanacetum coccineum]